MEKEIEALIRPLRLEGFTATCPKCKKHKVEDPSKDRVGYLIGAHMLNCKGAK